MHSSTMVVARVYMVILFSVCQVTLLSLLVVYGLWMGKKRSSYYDHKRIVAFSTSSQLVLVVVFSVIGGRRLRVEGSEETVRGEKKREGLRGVRRRNRLT